jgi:hypothetical protein
MTSNSLAEYHGTDHGQVDEAMQWLMRLLALPPQDLPAIEEVRATVAALSEPANPAWIMARVAALLNPYYDKDTPASVRRMEAEDWLEALASYPQWAIERAVRWWKSQDNADRRKRPIEGDIAARCKVEMRGIEFLPGALEAAKRNAIIPKQEPKPEPKRVSPEQVKAIARDVGIRIRGFPVDHSND